MTRAIVWVAAGLLLGLLLAAPNNGQAQDSQKIFMDKCAPCHGPTGKGNGPMASTFDPKPRDFCLPKFWQGNVDQKISDAVTKGKNQMVPVNLKPEELKAVIDYIKSSCKR